MKMMSTLAVKAVFNWSCTYRDLAEARWSWHWSIQRTILAALALVYPRVTTFYIHLLLGSVRDSNLCLTLVLICHILATSF